MAIPTQGGLGQASAAQAKPSAQAGANFDANAVQADNLEELRNKNQTSLRDKVADDLGDQREAMNSALVRMRQSFNERKNRMFDPVLMQTAAGFLKRTKTGSFGESLGNAAEGASVAAEREMLRQKEDQKLELELLGKEQAFRQQMGSDNLISALTGGPRNIGPAAFAGSAKPLGVPPVNDSQNPVAGAPNGAPPAGGPSSQNPRQVLEQATRGRIQITDDILLLASRAAPKLLPTLKEIRSLQQAEEKNQIDRDRLGVDRDRVDRMTRKVIPSGSKVEREMTQSEYDEYQKELKDYMYGHKDEQKLLNFYARKGYLDNDQVRKLILSKDGNLPSQIPRAMSKIEMEVDKETRTKTAGTRAEAAEKMATKLGTQAESAFQNTNIANDMIGFAKNNPAVFGLMNKPGLSNAVARAIQEGINVGNYNINLPASIVQQYQLSENDLSALQLFAQLNSQLQTRGRQLNRTPGEGSMSDYETKLLGGIYALPSDSARTIILKSDALKMQGMFDEQRFKLWNKKSKESGYSYNDFLVDDDFKKIKTDYRKMLDRVRAENMDLLSPTKKAKDSSGKPAVSTTPATPANETLLQRFQREKAEREGKK